MPMDWSSYFMGPGRFGMNPMMAGGYQLQPYDPRAAVRPMVDAANVMRTIPDGKPAPAMSQPMRPRLFGQRPGGPTSDPRRQVDRGVNTGRGFFADLRAFRDKVNPFGDGGRGRALASGQRMAAAQRANDASRHGPRGGGGGQRGGDPGGAGKRAGGTGPK